MPAVIGWLKYTDQVTSLPTHNSIKLHETQVTLKFKDFLVRSRVGMVSPPDPTPHEEKWSGEPNEISWVSEHFCH